MSVGYFVYSMLELQVNNFIVITVQTIFNVVLNPNVQIQRPLISQIITELFVIVSLAPLLITNQYPRIR